MQTRGQDTTVQHATGWIRALGLALAVGWLGFGPAFLVPAQAPGEEGPTIEELEKTALSKLREAHKAIKNKMDFLVTSLTKDEEVAAAAAGQLVDYGRSLLADGRTVAESLVDPFLEVKSSRQRARLGAVLARLAGVLHARKKKVLPRLLEAARQADQRLPAIVDVLIALNEPGVNAALAPLLAHDNPRVQVAVIRLLGLTGDRNDGPKVLAALASPDREVKLAVIRALRDLEFTEGAGQLLPLVASGDARVAGAAIDALAGFKAREAVPVLLEALEHSTETTRSVRLITALGSIGPAAKVSVQARVEKALAGFLTSKRESLVRAAGFALARLGKAGSEVERALVKGLREEVSREPRNFVARLEIARVLKQLGDCSGLRPYYTKAVKEYKSILRDHKRSPGYHTNTYIELAGCLARLGQFKSAARYLDKIPRKFTLLSRLLASNPDFEEMSKDAQYRRFFQ